MATGAFTFDTELINQSGIITNYAVDAIGLNMAINAELKGLVEYEVIDPTLADKINGVGKAEAEQMALFSIMVYFADAKLNGLEISDLLPHRDGIVAKMKGDEIESLFGIKIVDIKFTSFFVKDKDSIANLINFGGAFPKPTAPAGTAQGTPWTCSVCGNLNESRKFCTECGNKKA